MWGWLKSVGSWFSGGGKTVEKVTELIDEGIHTEQERSEQDASDTKDSRTMQFASHESWFDVLVDGMNRLVRPAFAFWSFGVLVGWWGEKIKEISPEAMNLILLIVTFYFGGRAILKDLPSVIKSLRAR
jgi:hypothetical protein